MPLDLAIEWIWSTGVFPDDGALQCFPLCVIQFNIPNAVRSNMTSRHGCLPLSFSIFVTMYLDSSPPRAPMLVQPLHIW